MYCIFTKFVSLKQIIMPARYLLFFLLVFTACSTAKKTALLPYGPAWGALYQQRAAEYKALCLQAYQLAAIRVEEMSHQQTLRPRAIVTDVDETVLDNSPFTVHYALQGKQYDQVSWEEWTARSACDTVPGALSFFRYAASKGFAIYYITNRLEKERAATLRNLQRWGFPQADDEHLLLSSGNSDKEARRMQVAKQYEIAMLVGDNLGDFSDVFYKAAPEERDAAVLRLRREFAGRFIMLPNVMYGDWLSALYPKGSPLNQQRADSALKAALKGY